MKIFIIAAQCAGKTTLAKYLQENTHLNIFEVEDGIMKLNGGTWPKDLKYKDDVLTPKVLSSATDMKEVILLDNHMSVERTKQLKKNGFSVILLDVSKDELLRRNIRRMKSEGYEDASIWIDAELRNIQDLQEHKLIDRTVSGEQSVQEVASQVKDILELKN